MAKEYKARFSIKEKVYLIECYPGGFSVDSGTVECITFDGKNVYYDLDMCFEHKYKVEEGELLTYERVKERIERLLK